MFQKILSLVLVVSFAVVTTGCSTITKGSRQLVSFNTQPTGAKVKIGGLRGTTPYTANLSTGQDYLAEFSLDGYEDAQVQVTKSFRTGTTIFGNILWLMIGVIVDVSSGAAYGLEPSSIDYELEKK